MTLKKPEWQVAAIIVGLSALQLGVTAQAPPAAEVVRNPRLAPTDPTGVIQTPLIAVNVSGKVVVEDGTLPFFAPRGMAVSEMLPRNGGQLLAVNIDTASGGATLDAETARIQCLGVTCAPVQADGSFQLQLRAPAMARGFRTSFRTPEGYALKSITWDGVDLLSQPLQIDPAVSTLSEIHVTLTRTASRMAIRGHILEEQTGKSVDGGAAQVLLADGQMRQIVVSPDGSFELQPLPKGSYTFHIETSGYRTIPRTVVLTAQDEEKGGPAVELTARAFHSIHGRVLDALTKAPVIQGTVSIVGPDGKISQYVLGGNGAFDIPGLVSGAYKLGIQAFGYSALTRSVLLTDGDGDLELTVQKMN